MDSIKEVNNYYNQQKSGYDLQKVALRKGEKCARFYMPYPIWHFGSAIHKARDIFPEATNFLDIGCGIGDKLQFAEKTGLDSYGIELSETLANKAIYKGGKVFITDAMKFKGYNSFEIIYLWNPIPYDAEEKNWIGSRPLTEEILKQIKDKTVIIAPQPTNTSLFEQNLRQVDRDIFCNF